MNDLDIYERHATEWWDDASPMFRSLRSVCRFQLAVLLERLGPRLAGVDVCDLGCGGGLLSLPLAERGARVVGVDLGLRSLLAARARGVGAEFVRADATRPPFAQRAFDVVLLADVVEHVRDRARLLAGAAALLRTGGLMFVATLNRTLRSALLAVGIAELLRLVPRGTHDPRLFVRPAELTAALAAHGCVPDGIVGARAKLFATLRAWTIVLERTRSPALAYIAMYRRLGAQAGVPPLATQEAQHVEGCGAPPSPPRPPRTGPERSPRPRRKAAPAATQ